MPHFDAVAVIVDITEEEFGKLKGKFGWRASVKAKWSFNGEIVDTDGWTELERLNKDQEYAEEKLMQSNQRM